MYLDNKYTKWYNKIVENARARLTVPTGAEKHHIIPESFFINRTRKGPPGWLEGNPEAPENKVHLTGREHIICHILLVKMTTGIAHKKMVHGLWMMSRAKLNRKKLTARQYEFARNEFRKVIKVTNSYTRRPRTEEEKLAHSIRTKGIPKTEKTKENMKEAWKRRGRTVKESTCALLKETSTAYWANEGTRQAQSAKRKAHLAQNPESVASMVANLKKRVVCKHCGTETNIGNHNRWHGDNCRINTV